MSIIKESAQAEIIRDLVSIEDTQAALRAINCYIWEHGLSKEEIDHSSQSSNWLYGLIDENHPWSTYILTLQDYIGIEADEVWTQILMQFPISPDSEVPSIKYHIDPHPEGYELLYVAGVALTESSEYYGGIRFEDDGVVPHLRPGDGVVFRQEASHSGGANLSSQIRYAVYFRYLNRL